MPQVFATNYVPGPLRWWGIQRELVPGTLVMPAISFPADKGEPENKPEMMPDNGVRGMMGVTYGMIQGVEIADFPVSGSVYLDPIGHELFNLFGDYTAIGTASSPTWTATGGVAAGATAITVTSGSVAVQGTAVQIQAGAGPSEICIVGSGSTATNIVLSALTPTRLTHTGSTTVTTVVAPFTHTFSLLNSGNGQPPTHTLTFHDGLSTNGARQYGYWCSSGIDFKMGVNGLFQRDTKATSLLGQLPGSAPTNTQTTDLAVAAWNFKTGVGGPASGGTLLSNIVDASVALARDLKPQFTLQGAQGPFAIPRLGLSASGKLTFMAADESPLLAYLNNTTQPLQLIMSTGSGASTLAVTFNFGAAQYKVVQVQVPDVFKYDVTFEADMNATNAGASGGMSPCSVVLTNATPTY